MGDLRTEFTSSDLENYVVFRYSKGETWQQVVEPGVYEADCFVTAGLSWSRYGTNYGTVCGSSTSWNYSREKFRYMPSLPEWCRKIIEQRGFYTGGGGESYNPGDYVFFNNGLYAPEAVKRKIEWISGGYRNMGYRNV